MRKTKIKIEAKDKKTSFSACPCVGATLDKLLQPAILAILANESMHGYELAKRLAENPVFLESPPDISGIYRILKSLEARGMVVADWDVSEMSRTKRLYTITDDGRQCLVFWHETLQNYHNAIAILLKTTKQAIRST